MSNYNILWLHHYFRPKAWQRCGNIKRTLSCPVLFGLRLCLTEITNGNGNHRKKTNCRWYSIPRYLTLSVRWKCRLDHQLAPIHKSENKRFWYCWWHQQTLLFQIFRMRNNHRRMLQMPKEIEIGKGMGLNPVSQELWRSIWYVHATKNVFLRGWMKYFQLVHSRML